MLAREVLSFMLVEWVVLPWSFETGERTPNMAADDSYQHPPVFPFSAPTILVMLAASETPPNTKRKGICTNTGKLQAWPVPHDLVTLEPINANDPPRDPHQWMLAHGRPPKCQGAPQGPLVLWPCVARWEPPVARFGLQWPEGTNKSPTRFQIPDLEHLSRT